MNPVDVSPRAYFSRLLLMQPVEILGRYPARSVLPHEEKMSPNPWFTKFLVMVSQKIYLMGKCFIILTSLKLHD